MPRGQTTKYLPTRWEPRVNQYFAVPLGDVVYEGKRREFIDDDKMPFVFKNKEQIRALQSFVNHSLELRKKYGCPHFQSKYIFLTETIQIKDNYGENIMDFYFYENGFILPDEVPTEEVELYHSRLKKYLAIIEDIYTDEYFKDKFISNFSKNG